MAKEKLFSVTAADCEWQYFCAGGPGGQKQNKTASACRVIHKASGAVGESREHREQARNKTAAWGRMIKTETFQKWLKLETRRALGQMAMIDSEVEKQMRQVKVEVKDENGRWVDEKKAQKCELCTVACGNDWCPTNE